MKKNIKINTLGRLKAKAYSLFKGDIHSALLTEEREKFERLRQADGAEAIQLHNYAEQKKVDVSTYLSLHDGRGYSENNWGFDLAGEPEIVGGGSFFEFGAGNGAFLDMLRRRGEVVAGVDLINPNRLPEVITGDFKQAFESEAWREAGVIISADFLEHLELADLEYLFAGWAVPGKRHCHLIACYDDHISHKTVMPPHLWALLLSRHFRQVEIRSCYYRRYQGRKLATCMAFQT